MAAPIPNEDIARPCGPPSGRADGRQRTLGRRRSSRSYVRLASRTPPLNGSSWPRQGSLRPPPHPSAARMRAITAVRSGPTWRRAARRSGVYHDALRPIPPRLEDVGGHSVAPRCEPHANETCSPRARPGARPGRRSVNPDRRVCVKHASTGRSRGTEHFVGTESRRGRRSFGGRACGAARRSRDGRHTVRAERPVLAHRDFMAWNIHVRTAASAIDFRTPSCPRRVRPRLMADGPHAARW